MLRWYGYPRTEEGMHLVHGSTSLSTRRLIATGFSCDTEFIHLLASEANEICEKEMKKTIAAEHVIAALKVRKRWGQRVILDVRVLEW